MLQIHNRQNSLDSASKHKLVVPDHNADILKDVTVTNRCRVRMSYRMLAGEKEFTEFTFIGVMSSSYKESERSRTRLINKT
jgi:hypothetical protein